MVDERQKIRKLCEDLTSAGYQYTRDEGAEKFTPGMSALELKLGIQNAQRTMSGADTLIQIHNQQGGKMSTRMLEVPEERIVQYALACNYLNAAQQFMKYYVAPENGVLYVEHDFQCEDDNFSRQLVAFLPTYKQNLSSASMMLTAAAQL